MNPKANDPAFPIQMPVNVYGDPVSAPLHGLTKREYFAGLAMQGLCSLQGLQQYLGSDYHDELARQAVRNADALIKELERGREGAGS